MSPQSNTSVIVTVVSGVIIFLALFFYAFYGISSLSQHNSSLGGQMSSLSQQMSNLNRQLSNQDQQVNSLDQQASSLSQQQVEFGMYLTRDNTKIVSDSDIQYYNATSHELRLTSECAERLNITKRYLEGNFTIVVRGEVILRGLFVPPFVSRSYPSSQVVITYPTWDENHKIMKIQMGYPWDQPTNLDPLANLRLTQYFEGSARLVQ